MSDNGKQEARPTFDFSKVNRQWNREFAHSLAQAARMQIVIQRQPNDGMDDAEIDKLLDRQEEAFNVLEGIADEQAKLMVQVLADVPVEWLLPGSPDDLDWSRVESLDYIQSNRYAELLEMLRTMDIAGDDSKNSPGHSRSRQKRRGR